MTTTTEDIKQVVKERYGRFAVATLAEGATP
jgi:hypothetical protein